MLVPVKEVNSNQLGDVIDLAINKYLWDGVSQDLRQTKFASSCSAIAMSSSISASTIEFLRSLGCGTDSNLEFNVFAFGEQRQQARALWLTWARKDDRARNRTAHARGRD